MSTRIGLAPLLEAKAGSVALPDEITLYCPQCGTPCADKGQCIIELKTANRNPEDNHFDEFPFYVELVVDCRSCGCYGSAPVSKFI